jgi:cytochrome d ubiquinol oxidase subunit II
MTTTIATSMTYLGLDLYLWMGLILLLAIIAYAVLAGADFGGGMWDLFASGPHRGKQRKAIAAAIGPVWEANHVWIIFLLVVLFSEFPLAMYVINEALYWPLHLLLIGIVLRGAAFVLRTQHEMASPRWRFWGSIFGSASIITPFILGTMLAAISSGGIRYVGNQLRVDPAQAWYSPVSILVGLLTLAVCSYLAAVYLTVETRGKLQADFRQRALIAWVVVAVLAGTLLFLSRWYSPLLWAHFAQRSSLPSLVLGLTLAILSGWSLYSKSYVLARIFAVGEVIVLIAGWAMAQYPYLIYPDLTLQNAGASPEAILFLLRVLPFGLLILVPSLYLLYAVFKKKPLAE